MNARGTWSIGVVESFVPSILPQTISRESPPLNSIHGLAKQHKGFDELMTSWAEEIKTSLLERDSREKAHAGIIESYRRLVQHTIALKERNCALLQTSASPGKTVFAQEPPGGDQGIRKGPQVASDVTVASIERSSAPSPAQAAYLATVEAQLAQSRQELSDQYKIQSSNSQRLLILTDNLRELESKGRQEKEELRRFKTEVEGLREKARWHKEIVAEKEKQLLILQDDHASLELELSQIMIQNENLKTDNASLLHRWIDSKNEEASRVNEANVWIQEAAKHKTKPATTKSANFGSGSASGDSGNATSSSGSSTKGGAGRSIDMSKSGFLPPKKR